MAILTPENGRRSIPACAGEPGTRSRTKLLKKVYPRVCGGTNITEIRNDLASGLSPRVRGNPASRPGRKRGKGSIPACAGEP